MTAPVLTEPDLALPARPSLAARLLRGVLPYVLALVLAFVVAGIVIAALGYDPIEAYRTIFTTSFRTGFGFTETLTKWVPLTLLALGFTIPLAVGKFNIGGEGQLLVGATAAAGVGIVYADLPFVRPAASGDHRRGPGRRRLGGHRGLPHGPVPGERDPQHGAAELRLVPGARLRRHRGWSDPAAGVAATQRVGEGAELPTIGGPPGVHAGLLLAALVAVATIVVTRQTAAGFELRAAGTDPRGRGSTASGSSGSR